MPSIIFLANEEYPPYTSENLKNYGVTSAIVTAAFRLESIETQYEFLPSARAYYMTRIGDFDGTVPWAKREGREQHFFYSESVIEVDKEYFYSLNRGLKKLHANGEYQHLMDDLSNGADSK